MIAARNAFLMSGGSSTPIARDYVQNGLVAMWDGIENAGWGVHEDNPATWKELVGTIPFPVSRGSSTWGNSYIQNTTSSVLKIGNKAGTKNNNELRNWFQNAGIFGTSSGYNLPLVGDYTLETVVAMTPAVTSYALSFGFDFFSASQRFSFVCGNVYSGSNRVFFVPANNWSSTAWNNAFYIDNLLGKPVSYSGIARVSSGGTFFANGNVVYAGTTAWPSNRTWDYRYAAQMVLWPHDYLYCVRLYSRALTAAEVAANYAIDAARFGLSA